MHTHHDVHSALSFSEKITHLVEHWIKHNEEHAKTYLLWAERSSEEGLTDATAILKDIAQDAGMMNKKFQKLLEAVSKH